MAFDDIFLQNFFPLAHHFRPSFLGEYRQPAFQHGTPPMKLGMGQLRTNNDFPTIVERRRWGLHFQMTEMCTKESRTPNMRVQTFLPCPKTE
jgi:hypothetical protein